MNHLVGLSYTVPHHEPVGFAGFRFTHEHFIAVDVIADLTKPRAFILLDAALPRATIASFPIVMRGNPSYAPHDLGEF